jgi:glycosyltransferase involved in cell wall biosynthesis
MRIVVDGYELGPQGAGVGRVAKNILPALASRREETRFFVLTREIALPFSRQNIQQIVLPSSGGYFRWQNGPFWRACQQLDPDLILAFNYTLPLICPWPSLLFVHDLSLLSHPEWFPPRTARWRRLVLRYSLRRANLLIVPSKATAEEVDRHLKTKKNRVRIIYYGVEDKFNRARPEAVQRWKEARGLGSRRVIGFLGSIFRRRHLPLLVAAVNNLRPEWPDLFLYVVGQDRTHPAEDIASLLSPDWIRWDEFLPETDLPLFYSACEALAYLSEYEGFGLPPLEALACGTIPVVLNRSSLGEILKGMAEFVEETTVEAVTKALRRAITDETRGNEIRRNFETRREMFSWSQAAAKVADCLREIKDKKL